MKRFVRSICIAALIALPAAAYATTVEPRSGEELTAQADLIVIGRCVEVKSQWFGRSLATLATIEVDETLKGETDATLVLALPGGVDVDKKIAMTVPGAPLAAEGEEMLLFLNTMAEMDDAYRVTGFSQGLFPVVRKSATKTLVTGGDRSSTGALALEMVKAQIRSYLKVAKKTPQ